MWQCEGSEVTVPEARSKYNLEGPEQEVYDLPNNLSDVDSRLDLARKGVVFFYCPTSVYFSPGNHILTPSLGTTTNLVLSLWLPKGAESIPGPWIRNLVLA